MTYLVRTMLYRPFHVNPPLSFVFSATMQSASQKLKLCICSWFILWKLFHSQRIDNTFLNVESLSQRLWVILDFWFTLPSKKILSIYIPTRSGWGCFHACIKNMFTAFSPTFLLICVTYYPFSSLRLKCPLLAWKSTRRCRWTWNWRKTFERKQSHLHKR